MNYFSIPGHKSLLMTQYKLTPDLVMETIGKYFNVDGKHAAFTTSRRRDFVTVRQIITYFMVKKCGMNKLAVGVFLNQDHSTVIYSINHVSDLYDTDPEYRKDVLTLQEIFAATVGNAQRGL